MARAKKTSSTVIKDTNALKSMTKSDLTAELRGAEKEYYLLTMKHSLGELKQPHMLTLTRRYIARVSTFLTTAL